MKESTNNPISTSKSIAIAAFIAFAAYSFWWMAMNYKGYCHAENRYLSDSDISEMIIKNMPNDFSKYYEVNCCAVDRVSFSLVDFSQKIMGEKNISATHEAYSRQNPYHTKKLTYIELNNCGEILNKFVEHK